MAERAGITLSEDDVAVAGLFIHDFTDSDLTVREWREMLAPVTALIEERTGQTVDREVAADYRVAAITQAGLLEPATTVTTLDSVVVDAPERFLDSEIVAVYW